MRFHDLTITGTMCTKCLYNEVVVLEDGKLGKEQRYDVAPVGVCWLQNYEIEESEVRQDGGDIGQCDVAYSSLRKRFEDLRIKTSFS